MSEPRVGVDVGGTFTDVALLVDGSLTTAKVPTTDDQSVGVVRGIEKACREADVDPADVDSFGHAMTVATNALLEGTGAETALVTTEGFRDVLEIRRQDRPSLYDLDADLPDPLVPRGRRFELPERATPEGVEREVAADDVAALVSDLRDVESVAVCLLHAYAHPENETRVAAVLDDELDAHVSVSHEVLAEFREYERTATTVVDAYVTPTIAAYVGRLTVRAAELGVPAPRIMQSNGGIADAEAVRASAVRTALSGPAAGVVGAAATGGSGDGLVTFDMGGTSTDVGLVRDGAVERTTEGRVGDHPVRVPMVDVTTIGAGGGSVAWVDTGGALRVGPRSAGATPGPACYGRGGADPTVTDAAVVLGYVGRGTALGGELELDTGAAESALATLADDADLDGPLAAARGVYRVVTANMTRAVRSVTVERGHDPRGFSLVGFGGAGPMHAAALAARLGVERVVVPRPCGVLSAYGLLAAEERHDAVRTARRPLADAEGVDDALASLADGVREDVSDPEAARVEFAADLRYAGQSFELEVPVERPVDPDRAGERFHAAHERAYGYRMDDPVELVNLRARAVIERPPVSVTYEGGPSVADARRGTREASFADGDGGDGGTHETPVFDRERLPVGGTVDGPAICEQAESTVVVPPAWTGTVRDDGALVLTRGDAR